MKEYLKHLRDNSAKTGYFDLVRATDRRFEEATGHSAQAATIGDVDAFIEHLKGYIDEHGGSHAAKATARQYVLQARRIAEFYGKDAAVRRISELKLNKVFEIHTRSADIVAEERSYTEEELNKIITYARTHKRQEWTRPVILLLAATGCRISEIAQLRVRDVTADGQLHITGKGRKERIVSVGMKEAQEALKEYIKSAERTNPEAFVFSSDRWNAPPCLRTATIRSEVNKMLTELGIKKRGKCAHGLRHTLFSIAARKGVAPKVIQAQAGHASLTTTMNIYVHTDKEQVREEFGELWKGIGEREEAHREATI